MKAWELTEFGLDKLSLADRPEPEPGPGQVKIRVRAAALNSRDLQVIYNKYDPNQRLPIVPVSDGVGEIVEVGDGVTRVEVGQRVVGVFCQRWVSGERTLERFWSHIGGHYDGMLQEYAVFEAEGVIPIPDYLTDAEAAAGTVASATAWQALVVLGDMKAGDTVLVEGTGGVSIAALQFALATGARVIVTSSSDAKIKRAIGLGASSGVNYVDEPEWGAAVRELTDGVGVDHVIENAGDLERSAQALRAGGLISLIGYMGQLNLESPEPPAYGYTLSVLTALLNNVRTQGISAAPRESYESMYRAMEASEIRPVVDREYAFEDAVEALTSLRDDGAFGKLVINVG